MDFIWDLDDEDDDETSTPAPRDLADRLEDAFGGQTGEERPQPLYTEFAPSHGQPATPAREVA